MAFAGTLTATGDRLRNPDQFRWGERYRRRREIGGSILGSDAISMTVCGFHAAPSNLA
jgi:hypothetical protein